MTVTATRTTRKIVRPSEEEIIRLELPIEVAETLLILFGNVGGAPDGRRGDIAQIAGALREAGVLVNTSNNHFINEVRGTAIYFKDERTPARGF